MLHSLHSPAFFWPHYKYMQTSVGTLGVYFLLTLAPTASYSAGRLVGAGVCGGRLGVRG